MKSIIVELSEFLITVREGNDVVRQITDCAFGRQEGAGNTTPVLIDGRLSSWKRKADYRSATYPEPHGGAPMDYALFLDERPAVAFHVGSTWDESHGCIHLNRKDAAWLFDWAAMDPVAVTIRGPHPAPGVRARTYKVGAANMLARVVREIRAAVIAEGFPVDPNGASFDQALADAVTAYQTKLDIGVDGQVGSETSLRMGIAL